MAIDKVVIPVEVTSNGTTDKEIQKANALKAAYQSASAAAKGGTPGSRAAAGMSGQEYGMARGTTARTGASARDFANEAQGLGGLVRLYATYAANVFAVSAAFRALSDAMDTSNMIRGLDQLGASTGVAMGGLAKRFAEASGGAISLRESMESTAKAMSSGMSQKQFLVLGDVARKASQALGVNMSDAVSRLTRGITKLEPELLDELGLFTKVGKASEDYARSVGKSVDNLTDFEKRQAFANAVLKEGIDKFKDIEIPTNPYDKLLASLKNVSQGILELVNKGLTPLVGFLSESPTALTAVIAGLGTLILRQALPIFTSYRAAMQKATEEMKVMAEAKAATAKKALEISRQAREQEMAEELKNINDVKVARIDAAETQLKAVAKKGLSKRVQTILDPLRPVSSITKEELDILDKYGEKTTKVAKTYSLLAAAIRDAQEAERTFQKQTASAKEKIEAPPAYGTAAYARLQDLERARKQAAGAALVGRVGETVSTIGTVAATKELLSGLQTEKLGLFRGGLTAISGAATIAMGTISNLFSVMSKFLGWIGLAVTAFDMLSGMFSKNGKQVELFNTSLEYLDESVKTATDTAKKYQDTLSVDSILAKSNALTNLSDSISKTAAAFIDAKVNASWFDNLTNTIAGWFGLGLEDKLQTRIQNSVKAGLANISDPKLKKEAEAQIAALLGTGPLTSERLQEVASKIPAVFENVAKTADKAALPVRTVKDGFVALDKAYQELKNSFAVKDPVTEFATKLSSQASLLADILKDPINGVATLNDILKDTSQINMFPPAVQKSITDAALELGRLNKEATSAQEQIDLANKKLAAARDMETSGVAPEITLRFKLEAEGLLASATQTYKTASEKITQISSNVSVGLTKTVQDNLRFIEAPLTRAIAKAGIETQKTLLSYLPKTPETAKLQADLEIKSIDLRVQEITSMRDLISAIDLDRISREKQAIQDKLSNRAIDQYPEEKARLEKEFKGLTQQEQAYKDPTGLRKSGEMVSGGAQKILRERAGFLAQVEELTSQKQQAAIKGRADAIKANFDMEKSGYQDAQKYLESQLELLKASDEFRGSSLEKQQESLAAFADAKAALSTEIALSDKRRDIAVQELVLTEAKKTKNKDLELLAQSALLRSRAEMSITEQTLEASQKAVKIDRDRADALAITADKIALANIEWDKQNQLKKISSDIDAKLADVRKQELQYLLDTGQISQDAYTTEIRSIERANMARSRSGELLQLEIGYLNDVNTLLKEYATANASRQAEITATLVSKSDQYKVQVAGINQVYDAQQAVFDQQNSLSKRQEGYADIVKNSFNSMADAMVEWAKTGKLSGKDLFTSLIADLARYEMRLQMLQAYGVFRNAVFGIGAGGGSIPGVTNVPNMDAGITALPETLAAKGRVYDAGLQMFAKGGAFTNSIVTSPTLFKFAQGTGLMGEAGPEAIMPLKRDANGNLGVRTDKQDSNVEVVINNYSNAQATTKETDDGRGNRRIEVMIGEAAAGEMSRSGSSAQGTMRNTYGLAPQLIRR